MRLSLGQQCGCLVKVWHEIYLDSNQEVTREAWYQAGRKRRSPGVTVAHVNLHTLPVLRPSWHLRVFKRTLRRTICSARLKVTQTASCCRNI